MSDGGVFALSIPLAPYRCPPGPYERASLMAYYLASRKPRSKVLVLDANDKFSKQSLFQAEWAARYGGFTSLMAWELWNEQNYALKYYDVEDERGEIELRHEVRLGGANAGIRFHRDLLGVLAARGRELDGVLAGQDRIGVGAEDALREREELYRRAIGAATSR